LKKAKPKGALSPDDQLEAIYHAGHLGNFWDRHEEPYQTFGDLIFEGTAHATFSNAIQALHRNNKTLCDTVSKADFAKAVVAKLRPFYDTEPHLSFSGLWKSLSKELLGSPAASFEVMREIHGIRLARPDQILTLGPFKIYSFKAQHNLLTAKALPNEANSFWGRSPPEYLIGVEVVARDGNRAYEVADIYFEGFERLLKFLVGRSDDRMEAGVLNYRGPKRNQAYAFCGDSAGSFSGRTGPIQALPLDDDFFRHPDLVGLWDLIVKGGSELERRLILAAGWVGQSYGDRALPSSFLKAAIALETLFTPQESAIITPSILSSLSESLAMLLADTPDERLEVERQVKRLYEKRSSIAHSGSADVDPLEVHSIQAIARAAILKIFTYEELNQLQSTKELFALIKMNKYAGPPLRAASERTRSRRPAGT
jgi:hypothetical protein